MTDTHARRRATPGARRRSGLAAVALSILGVALLGMGAAGKQEVKSNARAVFVDQDGTRVEAGQVTASGVPELVGNLGRGTLHIAFDDIATIAFEPGDERGDRVATIRLRNGESVTLTVRGSLAFYGQTAVGAYQVRARDLKTVEFAH